MATKEINIEITTDNSNNNNIQKKQIEDTNIIGKDDKVDNGNLIKDNAIEKFPWIPVLVNSLVIGTNAFALFQCFPYAGYMVVWLGKAKNVDEAGFYSGFLVAGFMIGRSSTSLFWGIVTDIIGRKPVIIIGCLAMIVFQIMFGLAQSFEVALASRILLGIFNGLVATSKTVASELVPRHRREWQAKSMSWVSAGVSVATLVGPSVGGWLSSPAEQYPGSVFDGDFLKTFPCIFISICMYEIFPLWLMASEKSGGMAMSLGLIGTIQSINGLCLLIYQSSIFPRLAKYMPPINFWVLSGLLSVPTIIFMPFTSQFSTADTAMDFTWAAILRSIQVVFDMSIFTSSFLLINNSCDALQRGAVNGLAMTIASFTKATGPILGSVIFAWSITNEMSFPFSHHFGFFIIAILYLIQSLVVYKFFPQKLNVMKGGAIRKEGNGE
eukprot:g10792.t1